MFQPALPFDGLIGWRFLQRTYDNQIAAFSVSADLQRNTDYFRENVSLVTNATQLVADRRLLSVALGAFGLQDDINNKFFIRKVLEDGTSNPDAFANRLADSRYRSLSSAFGFGPGELRLNQISGFADRIIEDYERQSFEFAVGQQNQTMRIALTAERVFHDLASGNQTENGKWFEIIGQTPMRKLFETVFSLPASFAQIDIDKQREVFAQKSLDHFGTSDPADFIETDLQEALLSRYTALTQLQEFQRTSSSRSIALQLLRS